MGLLARAFSMPEAKAQAVAATVTPYDAGIGSYGSTGTGPSAYWRNANEGYMLDELVYQCVKLRADSAGEPPVCAYRLTDSGEEKVEDPTELPALQLLNNPNPYMSRSFFWSTLVTHLDIGGDAYIEKVRSAAGKVVELWLIRPDHMTVLPDPQRYIRGYLYRNGTFETTLDPEDVIHIRTRNPLSDFYGLSPLAVLAGRVDLDVWTRKFTEAFFRNAGVPAGMLVVQKHLTPTDQQDLQRRFRELFGGEQGWHRVLAIGTDGDNQDVKYTPMGLGLGDSALAMENLNQLNESRILGVYGVPLSLLPTLAGAVANRGQTANVSEREAFWELTMVPLLRDIDAAVTMGLAGDFPEVQRFEHDLSKIHALQEDEDKKHARYRDDWKAGVVTFAEARQAMGYPEEPDEPGVVMLMNTSVPTPSDQLVDPDAMLEAEQAQQPAPQPQGQLPPGQQPQNGQVQPPQPAQNGVAH